MPSCTWIVVRDLRLWLNAAMNFMSALALPLHIGARYTRSKKGESFVGFISKVSTIGLALGVAVLIVVLSVMNGFDKELRTRILGMVPHGVLYSPQPIANWGDVVRQVAPQPGVAAAAPWVEGQGMVTQSGAARPLLYYGIDPELESQVSIIDDHMVAGQLDDLKPGQFGVILGAIMARSLGVVPGDAITLLIPEVSLTLAGVRPRLKRLTVVGVFEVGAELDANLAYIHWQDAAVIKRQKGKVDGVRVQFDDLFEAPVRLQGLAAQTDTRPRDWTRTHGNLFEAIALEKTMIGLLLTMIVAVAAFNIVSTLVMTVNAKRSDIAVLRVMGMGSSQVMMTFVVQGVFIGLIGIVCGGVLGIAIAFNVTEILAIVERTFGFTLFNAEAYFVSTLPSDPQADDIVTILAGSFLLCLLSTLYPAWRAARTEPAEVISGGH